MVLQLRITQSDSIDVTGRGDDSSKGGGELRHANKNAYKKWAPRPRITTALAIATLLGFFSFSTKLKEVTFSTKVKDVAFKVKEVAEEGQKPSEGKERSSLSFAVANAPIGSLGPKKTGRLHHRYYDSLFYAAMQFGRKAKNVIEVGCGYDPFVQHMTWIPEKICVAPYFTSYGAKSKKGVGAEIEKVTADFMDFELPNDDAFDLLICSQVIEHVKNPKKFMQKLIRSARIAIISVPYQWKPCVGKCGHKSHEISYKQTLEWSYPYVPIVSTIVEEREDSTNNRRIVLVFERDDDDA
jgi:SAM-dependent methyltransferase